MDQNSFRQLLKSNKSAESSSKSRGSLVPPLTSKPKAQKASKEPAFKPRKVKKQSGDSKYRDRAAERRVGEGNDYAHVEAVLEDFERRNADEEDLIAVDEKRRLLGGDSQHSVLVKGVDVALLEQNKARATQESTEDDEVLEQAFIESSSSVPKKRTREDLIRALKEKRQSGDVSAGQKTAVDGANQLEEAKKAGKFKPIGVPTAQKGKKKAVKERGIPGERKKKKRKIVETGPKDDLPTVSGPGVGPSPTKTEERAPVVKEPSEDPVDENFDIFAGVGDYEGVDLEDDDEDDKKEEQATPIRENDVSSKNRQQPGRQWIALDDSERSRPREPLPVIEKKSTPPPEAMLLDEDGEVPEQPTRLVPLASSALPSIKDFLAMDNAEGGSRKKRKNKKKGGGEGDKDEPKKMSLESKVDRDYQRLKSYTDKKAKSS